MRHVGVLEGGLHVVVLWLPGWASGRWRDGILESGGGGEEDVIGIARNGTNVALRDCTWPWRE